MSKKELSEFEPYLDFWLEGQRRGFAGDLPREKLPDSSKIVVFRKHPLVYVDRWYGSDLGGGQTILYSESGRSEFPLSVIEGTPMHVKPIARLGYSGQINRRFHLEELLPLGNFSLDILSQSDIIWTFLKSALSQVTRERPLRGPVNFENQNFPGLKYRSLERERTLGREEIIHVDDPDNPLYEGNYDFTLIKKKLEDRLE